MNLADLDFLPTDFEMKRSIDQNNEHSMSYSQDNTQMRPDNPESMRQSGSFMKSNSKNNETEIEVVTAPQNISFKTPESLNLINDSNS